ncbi:MAG: lactate utilization protein C [Beijerinckiaceae bacterium]|nr:lactate utilization protein C [Beijerinckiaceae bacterium]
MSEARDQILANIRRSLGVQASDTTRRQTVAARIATAPSGIEPARGQGSLEDRITVFTKQAESVSASVIRIASVTEAPEAIARYLRGYNLPSVIRMGDDSRLRSLNWQSANIETSVGRSTGNDLNAVSFALGGVAETGTLVLVSGPQNPTTLNFLPDNHIVIVAADGILPSYEAVFAQIRAQYGKGTMPRTVNLITGPSRSADIEQKLLLGAHGPRRLHVIIAQDG